MSFKPLVFFSGLTVGDYLLWNWSLSGNHEVIALVSGLTLPPLIVACLWLLAMSLARLLARSARRPAHRASAAQVQARKHAPAGKPAHTAATAAMGDAQTASTQAAAGTRKIAA